MELFPAATLYIVLTTISGALGAQSTSLGSVSTRGEQAVDGWTFFDKQAVSADGSLVVFCSTAHNLVPGDTNFEFDAFVRDLSSGATTRVSVDSHGAQADWGSWQACISADGRFVAFVSTASNLVPNDLNGMSDVFVHDLATGETSIVSVDSNGLPANGSSLYCSISGDGSRVAFTSYADNLSPLDLNRSLDAFVHDRRTGVTERVSLSSTGQQPIRGVIWGVSISRNGNFVAFDSYSWDLVPGDSNGWDDVFVRDLAFGVTTRVSVDSLGVEGNNISSDPMLDANGRFVVFTSQADNLVTGDHNYYQDVFVHDMWTGLTSRVNLAFGNAEVDEASYSPTISGDGFLVAFSSYAKNLVVGDANDQGDVFIHDRASGETVRVSVDSAGSDANDESWHPSISDDGLVAAFVSMASNLVPEDYNETEDLFIHQRRPPTPTLLHVGDCPGVQALTVSHATPGGTVVLITGPAGSSAKPTPPCLGIPLAVRLPTLRGAFPADGRGVARFTANVPGAACGLSVQAIDVTTCTPTNAILL